MSSHISMKAVNHFGSRIQIVKAMEELSELAAALGKYLCTGSGESSISEEIADVEIMLSQLYVIFGNKISVKAMKEIKLERLRMIIQDGNRNVLGISNEGNGEQNEN